MPYRFQDIHLFHMHYEEAHRPELWFLNFFKNFNNDSYYFMKGYIYAKNKVNTPNMFRHIHTFHKWDGRRTPAWPPSFIFLVIRIFNVL